jgi:hypothetical protein
MFLINNSLFFRRTCPVRQCVPVVDDMAVFWDLLDIWRAVLRRAGNGDPEERRRLRLHQGGVRLVAGVLVPVGGAGDHQPDVERDHGVDVRELRAQTHLPELRRPRRRRSSARRLHYL